MESPEVEKEVKRLLRTDLSASNVNILSNVLMLRKAQYNEVIFVVSQIRLQWNPDFTKIGSKNRRV